MLYDVDGYWWRRLIVLSTGQTTPCNFHIQNREEGKKVHFVKLETWHCKLSTISEENINAFNIGFD